MNIQIYLYNCWSISAKKLKNACKYAKSSSNKDKEKWNYIVDAIQSENSKCSEKQIKGLINGTMKEMDKEIVNAKKELNKKEIQSQNSTMDVDDMLGTLRKCTNEGEFENTLRK
ncbi:MAG: hypothetical protein RsTaC01_0142 [Candidatus Paraimprobicoccus trichonymphae]|uniref:Uncharacterized protein n=1 Tax=Candidatus Paraimprobicoccus trichonymphae TaxID=3033793 RepID=A0AA48KVY7_9FIRM|nr:MAG: hypothetical protein RsTaC01_0142 [Candidatus Paraimprobicoccus trichonymphae]